MNSEFLCRAVVFFCAAIFPGISSIQAQESVPAPSPAAPTEISVGIYLLEIRDIAPADGTFAAEFWIWSQADTNTNVLGQLEFLNADKVTFHSESNGLDNGVYWTKRRATGVFRQSWDMRHFPRDRQKLEILAQYNGADASRIILKPDMKESGYSPDLSIGGWEVGKLQISAESVVYDSSLGDPLLSRKSTHPVIVAQIDILRIDSSMYWKLMAAAYVAMIMCLVSFLLDFESPGSRYGLIGAGMFAAVVNFRSAGIALGADGTIIDLLHFVILGFLVAALLVTLLFSALAHRGVPLRHLRLANNLALLAFALLFILLNIFFFHQAVG